MLFQNVRSILKKECGFSDESKFLVGVSGGPDSVCLLDILCQLPYEIIIGHLDHGLRPSSAEEMMFVEKLAKKYECKFISSKVNISQLSELYGTGIEDTARRERYRFLFNSAEIEKADAVLVAHQADDQIETLLMNLIRGAGLEGFSGMQIKSFSEFNTSIYLVRPLLKTFRQEIMDYCHSHRLEYKLDESNESLSNTRARIRNHLIPELIKYNPNIKNTLLRTQQIFEMDNVFFKESIEFGEKDIQLISQKNKVSLELHLFNNLPESLQRLIIKDLMDRFFNHTEMISFSTIEGIRKIFTRETKKTTQEIAKNLYVIVLGKNGILIQSNDVGREYHWPSVNGEIKINFLPSKNKISSGWKLEIKEETQKQELSKYAKNKDAYLCYLDKDKITEELTVRAWVKGDKFQPLGMDGKSIKLSDYWINRKVPTIARKNWPLFLSGEEIIWIPGYQQAHNTRITEKTQMVVILRLFEKR
jgi:tRNA(Ile)-lysidine synthase